MCVCVCMCVYFKIILQDQIIVNNIFIRFMYLSIHIMCIEKSSDSVQ